MKLTELEVGQPVSWVTKTGRRVTGLVARVGIDQVQVVARAGRGISVKRWLPHTALQDHRSSDTPEP
jgi:hypothetical protein